METSLVKLVVGYQKQGKKFASRLSTITGNVSIFRNNTIITFILNFHNHLEFSYWHHRNELHKNEPKFP